MNADPAKASAASTDAAVATFWLLDPMPAEPEADRMTNELGLALAVTVPELSMMFPPALRLTVLPAPVEVILSQIVRLPPVVRVMLPLEVIGPKPALPFALKRN